MKFIEKLCFTLLFLVSVNSYIISFITSNYFLIFPLSLIFIFINILPSLHQRSTLVLKILSDGCDLLKIFLFTVTITSILTLISVFKLSSDYDMPIIINSIMVLIAEFITFWNGIIRVYCTSIQLGIKRRIIGAILGWIPLVNIYILIRIIYICDKEAEFEDKKCKLNNSRKDDLICKTRYPILLIHGVFFRDSVYLNYWGRIPSELIKNGATVYYGNHQSALSVSDSAFEIANRIKAITKELGCDKVNIIAHSKGGLDSRYAISILGMNEYVASLTTINTPHRGCIFADYLFSKASNKFVEGVANQYNNTLRKLGDLNPDFTSAVKDLTATSCKQFNEIVKDKDGIYYQSVASKQNKASNGKFPLNISYPLVKHFDGVNDGLVSKDSAVWGKDFTYITVKGNRGVAHSDVIDLTRENIKGFDVREFYVQMVAKLKSMGY